MADTKLLLVEDDENLAYMEKSCFEDIIGGYEVKTAVNGKEGLKAWRDFQPDVIVSDIDMPIMDGIEMVKNIREVDGETIILFTTGLTSPKDLKAGYAAGANNYIKKPFIPEELDAHIHSLIQLKAGKRSENASCQIKLGRYTLDANHATLKDTQQGSEKMLTAREAKILELLAVNKNEVVRREARTKPLLGRGRQGLLRFQKPGCFHQENPHGTGRRACRRTENHQRSGIQAHRRISIPLPPHNIIRESN